MQPSGQHVTNSLGNGFAALGGEQLLLFGDIGHHLGNFIQSLFCVRELLAQESIASTQPHVTELQWQEGDKEINQLLHKMAVAKSTV